MKCTKCNGDCTIKDTGKFISIKCDCEIILIYPDKFIGRKLKEEYNPKYKRMRKQ